MTSSRLLVLLALVGALLGGCGSRGEPVPERLAGAPTLPGDVVPWADGRTVHLGDREIEVPDQVDQVATTAGGVYVRVNHRLLVVEGDGVRDTGQRLWGDFAVDPSGRYLGYFDQGHGPRDRFDTRQLVTVLWDLRTRERVGASPSGMGDTGSDDLFDLYSESEVSVLGFTSTDLVVDTTDGFRRLSLQDGRARALEVPAGERPEVATQHGIDTAAEKKDGRWRAQPYGTIAVLAPSREFLLVSSGASGRVVADREGRPIRVEGLPARFWPGPWLDAHTIVVVGLDSRREPDAILRCDLTARACSTVVDESAFVPNPGGSRRIAV